MRCRRAGRCRARGELGRASVQAGQPGAREVCRRCPGAAEPEQQADGVRHEPAGREGLFAARDSRPASGSSRRPSRPRAPRSGSGIAPPSAGFRAGSGPFEPNASRSRAGRPSPPGFDGDVELGREDGHLDDAVERRPSDYHYAITFGTSCRAEKRYAGFVTQMLASLELPKPPRRPPPGSFGRLRESGLRLPHAARLGARAWRGPAHPRHRPRARRAGGGASCARTSGGGPGREVRPHASLAAKLPEEMRRYAGALDAGDELAAARARTRADRAAKAA